MKIKKQKDKERKVELLAPAGNMEKLFTAFHFGADAVYLAGKSFGLRAFADNFTREEILEAVEFAHQLGKKVYVTVNVFAYNRDFEELGEYVLFLQDAKVDAIIVSDAGVVAYTKKIAPQLSIHLSTQANTLNKYAVDFWRKQGVERIVLARECSFEDIAEINAFCPDCQTEVFVHGAMCISYSGRCLMSNYLTGRNANKGECVQACRWSWNIVEDARQDSPMQVMQDERGTYVFNSKDLNLIARLPQLIDCGVDSFKIEGRMKSPYYVATVVNAYRRAIDAYYAGNDICLQTLQKELCKTTHRQFTEGFVFDDGQIKQNYQTSRAVGDSEFLAVVLDYADGVATVQMRSRFYEGQQVEILSPNSSFGKIVPITNLHDVNGVKVMDAKIVQQTLLFDCPFELQPFDILRTV